MTDRRTFAIVESLSRLKTELESKIVVSLNTLTGFLRKSRTVGLQTGVE